MIDGHAVLHRAYHALPPLTSKVGQVNAVYGFVSMLFRLISDLRPTHIAVCLDRKEKLLEKKFMSLIKPNVQKRIRNLFLRLI